MKVFTIILLCIIILMGAYIYFLPPKEVVPDEMTDLVFEQERKIDSLVSVIDSVEVVIYQYQNRINDLTKLLDINEETYNNEISSVVYLNADSSVKLFTELVNQ